LEFGVCGLVLNAKFQTPNYLGLQM